MRRLIIILAIVSTCLGALGQGKVMFGNDSNHLFLLGSEALPVSPLPDGKSLMAVLYAGTSAGSLSLQTSILLNATGWLTDGRMANKNLILTGVPGASLAYFQIFVTDTGAALPATIVGGHSYFSGQTYFGTSGLFTATPGASLTYPTLVSGGPSASTWSPGPLVINGCLSCPPYWMHVSAHPPSVTVSLGSGVTFLGSADPYHPHGNLIYQWRKDGSPIAGATNRDLTLTNVTLSDSGSYSLSAYDDYNSGVSDDAILTVFIPVSINAGPVGQVVAAHATAIFTVGASAYPAPNYQWRFNGVAVAGANGSSLVITNVGTNHLGSYWVEVWNAYSSATSAPATLFMSPSLRLPFTGLVAVWGKEATLAVSAWGSGDLGYQWYKDGKAVSGGTESTLVIPIVQISDGGLYSVVVTSGYGSVTNPPAQLVINPANVALGLYAGITIEGVVGWTYGIEHTTDLTDPNSWQSLTNVTLTRPVELWVDQSINVNSPTAGKRFYRVSRTVGME